MGWLRDIEQDLRFAIRALRRSPGFAVIAVVSLALGIGATTAIFSLVYAVLLRPLPYKDSERLVRIVENIPPPDGSSGAFRRAPAALDIDELDSLRTHAQTLSYVGAYPRTAMWLNGPQETTQLIGSRVSASVFPMLGAQPLFGRIFDTRDETSGADPAVMLSYVTWQRYFDGNRSVLGRSLLLDGTAFSVVGVMPRGFEFPDAQTQFWISFNTGTLPGVFLKVSPIARLKDGVSPQAATVEVSTMLDQLRGNLQPDAPKDTNTPPSFEIIRLQDDLVMPLRSPLMVLSGSVAFVLLIACANVANLLLARAAGRRQEIGVRLALGASRGRLVRQFLTEGVLLAVIGGVVGSGVASGSLRLLRMLATSLPRRDLGPGFSIPRLDEVQINESVLAFTLAISLLTGLLFGLAPAIGWSRRHDADALRHGAGSAISGFRLFGPFRAQGILVVTEIGTALMLLVGGGLLIQSFIKLSNVDPGYDATNVLTFQVPHGRFSPSELNAFADQLIGRLKSLPDVRAVGYAHDLPTMPGFPGMPLKIAPNALAPLPESPASWVVSHDFLTVMGIPVVAGRGFGDHDRAGGPPVIVINQTLARRAFPGGDAVGKHLYSTGGLALEVIGVVRDIRRVGLDRAPGPEMFASSRQTSGLPRPLGLGPYFAVRTESDPKATTSSIRAIVGQVDPRARVENVATMKEILSNSLTRPRLYAVVLGIFAGVAGTLAGIGIYGLIAYAVAQRTREIGIRVALGATQADVIGLVLSQSLVLIGVGLVLGISGAAALTGYLQSMLFNLTPLDPATFVGVSLTLGALATLASYVPARRATKVDPMVALRSE